MVGPKNRVTSSADRRSAGRALRPQTFSIARLPANSDTSCGWYPAIGYRLSLGPTCDAGDVTNSRVRFEGPAALTLRVATALADADGVELISSDQPVTLDEGMVALNVTVEGAFEAVAHAVASIRDEMPSGASIEITGG